MGMLAEETLKSLFDETRPSGDAKMLMTTSLMLIIMNEIFKLL